MSTAHSLARQALVHGGVVVLLVYLLQLIDARVTNGAGLYLAAVWAFITGLILSHIIHEWCHYFGAVLGRSALTLKPRVHPLFFDFEFDHNAPRQFLFLSFGGLIGNVILLGILTLPQGPHSLVMISMLSAVAGQLVFVLILELPVSLGVLAGRDPLEALTAHFGQGGPLFLRAAVGGVITAALIFLVYQR